MNENIILGGFYHIGGHTGGLDPAFEMSKRPKIALHMNQSVGLKCLTLKIIHASVN